ncbi:MAG: N-succinylarginine dihydrolase [Gammaproteobacteria bacterium]|nr:N-succinylarginine dihydrolase [Gammaproteobacteria bacterium]
MTTREYNFDGIVGPTHNYAGLSRGNVASTENAKATSNPRQAALQGLEKMWALAQRGIAQAVLPPVARPNIELLRTLGFSGDDAQVLQHTARSEPLLLAAAYSASSMWTANAATVSPSADTGDGRLHLTVANLNNKLHRSHEHPQTYRILQAIFGNREYFEVHSALPGTPVFSDEGAANHSRFAKSYGGPGVELFVYGKSEFEPGAVAPVQFPARQTLEASRAVSRRHQLAESTVVFAQQNPAAIDRGVFHNDVIAVGNLDMLFYHEDAFLDETITLAALRAVGKRLDFDIKPLRVTRRQVSLDDAVKSYLFNSQLLQRSDGKQLLVVPNECEETPSTRALLASLTVSGGPIAEVLTFDLRQSMRNGGGPACLRLRVVLTETERQMLQGNVILDEPLYRALKDWITRHYRDRLVFADLVDPQLAIEVRDALQELESLLRLPGILLA